MHKRRIRNVWKRRGHQHIVFNRGAWTWQGLLDDFYPGFVAHIPFEREQPRAYKKYPRP